MTDYSCSYKNVWFFYSLISLEKKVWVPRYEPCITKITSSKSHFHLSSSINSLHHLSVYFDKGHQNNLSFHKESETCPQLCDWIHVLTVIALTEKKMWLFKPEMFWSIQVNNILFISYSNVTTLAFKVHLLLWSKRNRAAFFQAKETP